MNQHNLDAILVGTGEFSFSEGATSLADAAAKGYIDVGNVRSIAIQPEKEMVSHYGSYRGIRKKDKTIVTQSDLKYLVRLDEWKLDNLLFLFYGTKKTALTQAAISSATAIDDLEFSATAGVVGRWYPLLNNGVPVREILTLTIPTLTEGTHYELDKKLGRIRFLSEQSADLTPTVTTAEITALQTLEPLKKLSREGYCRLTLWDQHDTDILVLDHDGFKGEISINNQPEIAGDAEAELELLVEVIEVGGNVYIRES